MVTKQLSIKFIKCVEGLIARATDSLPKHIFLRIKRVARLGLVARCLSVMMHAWPLCSVRLPLPVSPIMQGVYLRSYIYEVAWLLKTICQDVFNIREYATLPTSTSRHSIFSRVPSQVSPTIERFFDARILVLWLLVQRLLAVAYNTWINLMVDFFRDSDSGDGRGRKQHEK